MSDEREFILWKLEQEEKMDEICYQIRRMSRPTYPFEKFIGLAYIALGLALILGPIVFGILIGAILK